MKFILCIFFVCAVTIAKPMEEAKKSEQLLTSLNTNNETVTSNLQKSSETNGNGESKTDDLKSADDPK